MSKQHLKFPSGRTIKNAKKDAKKLSKSENIQLAIAQRRIASENGIDLPWEQAIKLIENSHSGPIFRVPDGTKLPFKPTADSDFSWSTIFAGTSGNGRSAFNDHPEYAPFMVKSHEIDSWLARDVLGWVQHADDERRTWFDQDGAIQRASWHRDNHPYVMNAHLEDPWWEVCAFQPSSNGHIFENAAKQIAELGYTYELGDDGLTIRGFYRGKLIVINELSERLYVVTDEFLACRVMVAVAFALKTDVEQWEHFLSEWFLHFDASFSSQLI